MLDDCTSGKNILNDFAIGAEFVTDFFRACYKKPEITFKNLLKPKTRLFWFKKTVFYQPCWIP